MVDCVLTKRGMRTAHFPEVATPLVPPRATAAGQLHPCTRGAWRDRELHREYDQYQYVSDVQWRRWRSCSCRRTRRRRRRRCSRSATRGAGRCRASTALRAATSRERTPHRRLLVRGLCRARAALRLARRDSRAPSSTNGKRSGGRRRVTPQRCVCARATLDGDARVLLDTYAAPRRASADAARAPHRRGARPAHPQRVDVRARRRRARSSPPTSPRTCPHAGRPAATTPAHSSSPHARPTHSSMRSARSSTRDDRRHDLRAPHLVVVVGGGVACDPRAAVEGVQARAMGWRPSAIAAARAELKASEGEAGAVAARLPPPPGPIDAESAAAGGGSRRRAHRGNEPGARGDEAEAAEAEASGGGKRWQRRGFADFWRRPRRRRSVRRRPQFSGYGHARLRVVCAARPARRFHAFSCSFGSRRSPSAAAHRGRWARAPAVGTRAWCAAAARNCSEAHRAARAASRCGRGPPQPSPRRAARPRRRQGAGHRRCASTGLGLAFRGAAAPRSAAGGRADAALARLQIARGFLVAEAARLLERRENISACGCRLREPASANFIASPRSAPW